MQKTSKNTAIESTMFLLIGMTGIVAGNAITVASKVGSAFWTAASVNISQYFPITLGTTTILLGFVALLLNVAIKRTIDWRQSIASVIYMMFFGRFINFFTQLFIALGVGELPFVARVVCSIVGIFTVACGISIYQRVHIVVHPIDEVMHTMRFVLCKGNAAKGQIASFIPPIVLCAIMWWLSGNLHAIHIGTLVALLFQGHFVGWADQHVFPNLKHRYLPIIK